MLREALKQDVPDILKALVTAAKEGDSAAAKLVLDRVIPVLRPAELPTALNLPEGGTLTAKAHAVLSAAAYGEIAPSQAAQLISSLTGIAKISEIDELAARVAALEAKSDKPA